MAEATSAIPELPKDANPEQIQEHIQGLEKKRHEVDSRLRELDGNRRGRFGTGRIVRLGGPSPRDGGVVRSGIRTAPTEADSEAGHGKRTLEEPDAPARKRSAAEDPVGRPTDSNFGGRLGSMVSQVAPVERPKETRTDAAPVKQRNRQMFGALLGHLNKFKKDIEQTAHTEQAIKRTEAEMRAEVKDKDDRAKVLELEKKLFKTARDKEFALRSTLQQKRTEAMLLLQEKRRELQITRMQKFIRTQAGPQIFYIPAKMCTKTSELLATSAETVKAEMDQAAELRKREEEARQAFERGETNGAAAEAEAKEAPAEGEMDEEEEEEAEREVDSLMDP